MANLRDPATEVVNSTTRDFIVRSGPIQPNVNFPFTQRGAKHFRFQKSWYESNPNLEYSVQKDAAFCFCCRVFGMQSKLI